MKIKRVERVAIAVEDLDAARVFFERVLGAEFLAIEDVADQGFRYQPFRIADFTMELLCPYREDSVIAKFLRRRGQGVHHVSFEVEDLDQAVASLTAHEVTVAHRIDYPPEIVFEEHHWREAFVHPRDAFGVLLHLCEKRPRI